MDHRVYSAPRYHQTTHHLKIACGTRQILKNTEFVLLCSSMFEIASFGFVLLLIDDWQLVMQVNIRQSFFCQCLVVTFFAKLFDHQSF